MSISPKKIAAYIVLTVSMAVILLATYVPGCQPVAPIPNPTKTLDSVKTQTQEVVASLPDRADRIDSNTDSITKIVVSEAPKTAPKIVANTTAIKVETVGIKTDTAKLATTIPQIDSAKADVKDMAAANDKLTKANQKLEDDKKSGLQKLMAIVIIASVISIGVSVVLFVEGSKFSVGLGIGSIVVLIASIVVGYYSFWLALIGIAAVLTGIGYLIWVKVLHKQVRKELVQTVEATKQLLPDDARAAVFGTGAIPGPITSSIQSPVTQKIVTQIRDQNVANPIKLALPTTPVTPISIFQK